MKIKCLPIHVLLVVFTFLTFAQAQTTEDTSKTYVFECNNDQEFVFDINSDGAWLHLKDQTLQLNSPGGLLAYNAPGIELLIHEGGAILRQVDEVTLLCENNPDRAVWEHAKLNGVDFRAVGDAPKWTLEFIAGAQIVFTDQENDTRIETPLPDAIRNAQSKTTRWDSGELSVEVSAKPCQIDPGEESYESTVTVYVNGQELRGCGRPLH